jgi:hypothetical protein
MRSRVGFAVGVAAVIALGLASRASTPKLAWLDLVAYTVGVAIGALVDLRVACRAPYHVAIER